MAKGSIPIWHYARWPGCFRRKQTRWNVESGPVPILPERHPGVAAAFLFLLNRDVPNWRSPIQSGNPLSPGSSGLRLALGWFQPDKTSCPDHGFANGVVRGVRIWAPNFIEKALNRKSWMLKNWPAGPGHCKRCGKPGVILPPGKEKPGSLLTGNLTFPPIGGKRGWIFPEIKINFSTLTHPSWMGLVMNVIRGSVGKSILVRRQTLRGISKKEDLLYLPCRRKPFVYTPETQPVCLGPFLLAKFYYTNKLNSKSS